MFAGRPGATLGRVRPAAFRQLADHRNFIAPLANMSVVSSIIDALRRIGKPTEKSAIQRQDRQLQEKTVLERQRQIIRDPSGDAQVFLLLKHNEMEASERASSATQVVA